MSLDRHLHDAPRAADAAARAAARRRRCRRSSSAIDGVTVSVPAGDDDPAGRARPGHRHPDAVLPREPHAGQRLPRVRRRGHGLARARARRAHARSSPGWRSRPTRERVRHSRKVVLELLGSSVDLSLAGPAQPNGDLERLSAALRRRPRPVRAAGRGPRGRRARRARRRAITTRPRARPSPRPSPSP